MYSTIYVETYAEYTQKEKAMSTLIKKIIKKTKKTRKAPEFYGHVTMTDQLEREIERIRSRHYFRI